MVMVECIVVIIHVRIAISRSRRVFVRPTTITNIQGGMKFHLKSLHSRLKEMHEDVAMLQWSWGRQHSRW